MDKVPRYTYGFLKATPELREYARSLRRNQCIEPDAPMIVA